MDAVSEVGDDGGDAAHGRTAAPAPAPAQHQRNRRLPTPWRPSRCGGPARAASCCASSTRVGGDIQAYRALVSAFDPRLTACLIADPALFGPELPVWSLAERARRYLTALQARFPTRRGAGGWPARAAGCGWRANRWPAGIACTPRTTALSGHRTCTLWRRS
jgi:hypothetical protein